MAGCVSLHLSASILAPSGHARWVGLDLLAVGLLCQLENWLIASKAELAVSATAALEVPVSTWPLFVGFLGQFCALFSQGECGSGYQYNSDCLSPSRAAAD